MNSRTAARMGAPAFGLWLLAGIVVIGLLQADYTQDIGSYRTNIAKMFIENEQYTGTIKAIWYEVFVSRVYKIVNNADVVIGFIKSLNFGLIYLSYRRYIKGALDATFVLVLLIFAPVISENIHEYLRQGMALGVFLLAMTSTNRLVGLALALLAVLIHQSAVFLILCIPLAYLLSRMCFFESGEPKRGGIIIIIGAVTVSALVCLLGISSAFPTYLTSAIGFLGGSRQNTLGIFYLVGYAGYLGYRALAHGARLHFTAFVGLIIISALYPVILDFGRSLSIVMPLHIAAAMSLTHARDKYLDLAFISVVGLPLALLSQF
jgi:hypothetical protein